MDKEQTQEELKFTKKGYIVCTILLLTLLGIMPESYLYFQRWIHVIIIYTAMIAGYYLTKYILNKSIQGG